MAKVLENVAKNILNHHGIPVPIGEKIEAGVDISGAVKKMAECIAPPWIIKALIPMGKKGRAGLVQSADDEQEALGVVDTLLQQQIGKYLVESVWIEKKVNIAREFYVSIAYDGLIRSPIFLFSRYGGVDIEELTAEHSDSLIKVPINIHEGFHPFQARQVCFQAGLTKEETASISPILVSLYDLFYDNDLRLLEINPLAILDNGDICAVGTLMNMDDEALSRHPELSEVIQYGQDRSLGVLTELEKQVLKTAMKYQGTGAVRFTELDGDIAFAIIGGGASIVSMDAIIRCGGKPANYTDFGAGKGGDERMYALIRSALAKPGIKGFITGANIAGGGDVSGLGQLIANVLKEMKVDARTFPVVARWAGFGEEQALKDLQQVPGIHCYGSELSIEEAAEKIVELIKTREKEASETL